jgi:hypothetical protein
MSLQLSGLNGVTFPDNTIRGSGSLIASVFKNLAANSNGLNANVNVTADAVVLEKTDFSPIIARSVSRTINTATTGVDALDTGAIAASTWYYIWIISDGNNVRALASLSSTAPTMPSGYTFKARVGSFRTDGTANKYPLNFLQYGRRTQYRVAAGSNLTALPTIASGVAGTTTTWVAASIVNFVPTTAFEITVIVASNLTAGQFAGCAPNQTYTTNLAGANSGPVQIESNGVLNSSASGSFMLESTNVYFNSNQASSVVLCLGYTDNL